MCVANTSSKVPTHPNIDLIIQNNSQITAAYEAYLKSGTELTLKNDLFRIYKIESNDMVKLGDLEKSEGLSDRSRKSNRMLKGSIKIKVPPKNIQKVPSILREV